MKSLVIVESPAKAKTISTYLNSNPELVKTYGKFTVIASFGHVRDLKQKDLSVDIQNGFEPTYEIIPGKLKTAKEIIQKAKEHDHIFLAADSDTEGAAIAWHIYELCKGISSQLAQRCKRIVFQEITKNALYRAIDQAGPIDMNKVHAQKARRVLDRILGFKLSPLLWKAYKSNGIGLSAGRVQSAVLKIIIDKERTIEDKKSDSYWTVDALFENQEIQDAKFYSGNEQRTIHKFTKEEDVKKFFKLMNPPSLLASKCTIKERKTSAPRPFITSSLQQEAYNKLGFSIKKTMKVAQELYEKGLITYMRTDSTTLSFDAQENIKQYVSQTYGDEYVNGSGIKKGNKGHAQEAHECIRPTNVSVTSLADKIESQQLQKDHGKLYEMIWRRAIGSMMVDAIYEDLDIIFTHPKIANQYGDQAYFKGGMSRLKSRGWLILYENENKNKESQQKSFQELMKRIQDKEFKVKQFYGRNTWSSPPARFNEGSIIKFLDTNGIGRPATYSSILTKLYDKRYVDKQDFLGEPQKCKHYVYEPSKKTIQKQEETVMIGEEKSRLTPTVIGKEINDFLEKHFAYVVEKEFTASMETELDKISEGELDYIAVMNEFWKPLKESITKYETSIKTDKKTSKVDLQNLSPSQKQAAFKIKEVQYQVTTTRYGPAVSFKETTTGKTQYKDLKQYLRIQKKSLRDIDKKDIEFVINIPYDYKNGYVLKMGPYGLYIQKNGKENANLQYDLLKGDNKIADMKDLFVLSKTELDSVFERKKNYMKRKSKND